MIPKTTVESILTAVSTQFRTYSLMVDSINASNPVYFPLVTQDDDYTFEHRMLPSVASADFWDIAKLTKTSPLVFILGPFSSYFESNDTGSDVGFSGALDNYLYTNQMTCDKWFADAFYYVTGHKIAGIVVENTDAFVFAEFGKEYDVPYFTSLGSYQTENLNLPYGIYDEYTSFAPTDQVEVEILSGTINFDIGLLCKDENGDTFVYTQTVSGSSGQKVKLNLTKKITGLSGLTEPYGGNDGDMMRIQTIAPEV